MIACLLLCSLAVGLLPSAVFAEAPASGACVSGDALSVSGSGSFAQLLSQELSTQQSSSGGSRYPYGYSVSSLEFQENMATVTLEAAQDALLLVGIYTEDGNKLLNCVSTAVSAGTTQAQLAVPGEMPEYFYASAYLVNPDDYVPLCDQYHTPMYTQQMQKLLNSTADDYSSSRVWNLDDDETTNFAVFRSGVRRIDYAEGVNILVSADSETRTYVFENCNSSFTALWAGRIIAYMWQGQPLILKIASVQVDGTTVTLTGGELTMAEVFQYIKIEGKADTSDVIVQDNPDSPFVYVPPAQTYSLRTSDGTVDFVDEKLTFEPNGDDEESGKPVDLGISGSLELTLNGYLDYYLAESYQFLDVCVDYSAAVSLSFEVGKEDKKALELPLPRIECPLVIGVVSIAFEPTIEFEWSAEASITGSIRGNLAIQYDSIHGASNHSSDPTFHTDVKLEGTVKLGIDWAPGITIGGLYDLYVLHIELSLFTGVELTVTATSPVNETDPAGNPKIIHGCTTCIAGDFKPVFALELKIYFLAELVKLTVDIWESDLPSFVTFYMSCADGQWSFGLGSCPNQAQRVAVHVKEHDNTPAKNVTVTVTGTGRQFGQEAQAASGTSSWTQTYTTDENGIAYIYLYSGSYLFSALDMMVGQQIGEPCRVMIHSENAVALDILLEGGLDPATVLDPGVVAFGHAGAEGYTLSWVLYGSGELHIQGEGPMYEDWQVPWAEYTKYIRTAYVHEGVTTVGLCAFSGCERLVAVEIADTVEHIGDSAFSSCTNLRKVQLSRNLKTLGNRVFEDCRILQELTLPDALTSFGEYCFYECENLQSINIPQGITEIPESAFRECTSLRSIAIPDSVTSIGESAFYWCTGLVSVVVPGNVTRLADWTFGYCISMEAAVLPEGLLSIGEYAFYRNDVLRSVNIPSTVLTLGREAFSQCACLQSVVLPQGLTAIPVQCFYECGSLINTRIPENVTTIGAKAFAACDSFTEVIVPEGVTSIEQGAFAYCNNLAYVSLPSTLTNIGGGTSILEVFPTGAFESCDSLTFIAVPGSVETIGSNTFSWCENLTSVTLGEGIRTIGYQAFAWCKKLPSIVIPASVAAFGPEVFSECRDLSSICFLGSNPGIDNYTFQCIEAHVPLSACYPAGDSTWTSADLPDSRGVLWGYEITWYPGSGGASAISDITELPFVPASPGEDPEKNLPEEEPAVCASYEGEFETQFAEEGTLKTASFTGLVPGGVYLVLNVASLETDLLSCDNLLAVRQCVAEADGTLRLQYLQRVPTDNTYVLAFGIENRDISAASVSLNAATSDGSVQSPQLNVTLNGRTLAEGRDYLLSGDVSFVLPGAYSCTLTGIGSFCGSRSVSYTVREYCPFTDVVQGKYYYDAVLWAVKKEITQGVTPTTFVPDATVNRAQAVTFLWRAAGCPEPASQENPFTDVGDGNRFKDAILWAYHAGITSGKTTTTFCPGDPCTRVQVVTFLYRFAGEPEVTGVDNPFTDLSAGNRFYEAILWAYSTGVTYGKTATTFDLHGECTRAQIVTFLYRYAG